MLKKIANQSRDRLTALQALYVMRVFLNSYYLRAQDLLKSNEIDQNLVFNDLGILLNDLKFDDQGNFLNQKIWQDWLIVLEQVIPDYSYDQEITILQAYYVSKRFLENYCEKTVADDVAMLLYQMNILSEWMNSVCFVLNPK